MIHRKNRQLGHLLAIWRVRNPQFSCFLINQVGCSLALSPYRLFCCGVGARGQGKFAKSKSGLMTPRAFSALSDV